MLACFMPGLVFARTRYDLSCPEESNGGHPSFAAPSGVAELYVWAAIGGAFVLILASGLLHLQADSGAAMV